MHKRENHGKEDGSLCCITPHVAISLYDYANKKEIEAESIDLHIDAQESTIAYVLLDGKEKKAKFYGFEENKQGDPFFRED